MSDEQKMEFSPHSSDSEIIDEEAEQQETNRLKWREYYRSNRNKLNKYRQDLGQKAVKDKKYYCAPCCRSLTSSLAVKRHNASEKHLKKINHKKTSTEEAEYKKDKEGRKKVYTEKVKKNRDDKAYLCDVCNKAYSTKRVLESHKKTKTHQKKLKLKDL